MAFAEKSVESEPAEAGLGHGLHDGSWNLIDPDQIGNIAAKIMNAVQGDPDLPEFHAG